MSSIGYLPQKPNQVASGNGAVTLLFHAQRLRRAVPEPIRWVRSR